MSRFVSDRAKQDAKSSRQSAATDVVSSPSGWSWASGELVECKVTRTVSSCCHLYGQWTMSLTLIHNLLINFSVLDWYRIRLHVNGGAHCTNNLPRVKNGIAATWSNFKPTISCTDPMPYHNATPPHYETIPQHVHDKNSHTWCFPWFRILSGPWTCPGTLLRTDSPSSPS